MWSLRRAEPEPGGHGVKDLLQGPRNQQRWREGSEVGGDGRSTSEMDNFLFSFIQMQVLCASLWSGVLPLIFILYFAFHSVHYALGSVACAN